MYILTSFYLSGPCPDWPLLCNIFIRFLAFNDGQYMSEYKKLNLWLNNVLLNIISGRVRFVLFWSGFKLDSKPLSWTWTTPELKQKMIKPEVIRPEMDLQSLSSDLSSCPQLLMPLHFKFLEMQNDDPLQRNSLQPGPSLISVQMALKPLAPTALSAVKKLQKLTFLMDKSWSLFPLFESSSCNLLY